MEGDSVCVTPVPSCWQMMWLSSSTVQSPLQQEAGRDLLSSRQSLPHKKNTAAPSSCCQTHQLTTALSPKPFGEAESFPAVTAHGSREGKTCCPPHPHPLFLKTLPHLPPPGWRFFFSTLQPT